jgi:hypothetical protein
MAEGVETRHFGKHPGGVRLIPWCKEVEQWEL